MKTAFVAFALVVAGCSSSTEDPGTKPNDGTIDAGGSTGGATTGGATGGATTGGATTGGTTAGTTGGATTGGTTVDPTAACTASAAAVCGKLESCTPFGLEVLYGDAATCKERLVASCVKGLAFEGTSTTATSTQSCAAAIAAAACPAFLTQSFGAACTVQPGQVQNGKGCVDDAQCTSTFCARAASSTCGTCAAPTKVGDACVNKACSRGSVCPADGNTCIAPGNGKVGDACARLEDCDTAQGVGCNTVSKKCIALNAASAGERCGTDPAGGSTFSVCAASGTCSGALSGTCTAAAADGAACSTTATGAHCLAPAACVAGKCKTPDGICK